MKAYEVQNEWSIDSIVEVEREKPKAGPGQVVVAIMAASLNYRDLLTVQGKGGAKLPLIPFSDGAGDIVEVGQGVTRVKQGDRVCPIFFPGWIDGGPSAYGRMNALGGSVPGTLQEFMVLDAEAVTPIPWHLSYLEASTLPAPPSPHGARWSMKAASSPATGCWCKAPAAFRSSHCNSPRC